MKKSILIIIAVFLVPVIAVAAPFLICDPQAGVEFYEVFKDDLLMSADILAEPDGSLRYDLQGTTPGVYQFSAKACSEPWGCSTVSDPYESPAPALRPTGLRLAK